MTQPPPALAHRMLALTLPEDVREHVIDDLDEVYRRVLDRHGAARARRWYWREALTISAGFLVELVDDVAPGIRW